MYTCHRCTQHHLASSVYLTMCTNLLNLSTLDLADDLESLGANEHTSVRRMLFQLFLQWLRSRRSKCCGIYPKECSCCTGHENDPA